MNHYDRKLALAKKRGDLAAIAILEAGRTFTPDPETPMLTARLTPRVARLTERLAA
jgi:hypothetical protein